MPSVDPRIIDLYNEYVHSSLPRRDFITRLAELAGGAASAAAVLPLIEPNYAYGRQVDEKDKRITTSYVEYAAPSGKVKAYLAKPKRKGKFAAVLVIHENRGLNAHIEDVARRVALQGYLALAPDGLSLAGGAPVDQEAARDLFAKNDRERITADVVAGVPFLASHPDGDGKIGTVGFCYGGGVAVRAAVDAPSVLAAVSFYGSALPSEEVPKLKAPVLAHYAGTDERINAAVPEFRKALEANQVAYSLNWYPGTQHGFHNDASEGRYNEAAAKLAWTRTVAFFKAYLT